MIHAPNLECYESIVYTIKTMPNPGSLLLIKVKNVVLNSLKNTTTKISNVLLPIDT